MRDFWWENHETLISHVTLLYLVGGIPTPLKNIKVNGKDYPIDEMENKSHVPNHQPVYNYIIYI